MILGLMKFKSFQYKQSNAVQCNEEDLYLGDAKYCTDIWTTHPIQMSINNMRDTHLKTAKFLLWPEKKDGLKE